MKIEIKKKKKKLFAKKRGELKDISGYLKRSFKFLLILFFLLILYSIYSHTVYKQNLRIVYVDILEISKAIENFRFDFNRCPKSLEELVFPPENKKQYLEEIPLDPWGTRYYFRCPGRWNKDSADIASAGPDKKFSTKDDITNVI